MPYDPSYLEYVQEQLGQVLPAILARPMFGGLGLYSRGIFFALIANDRLYFYTDENNRPGFVARGMDRFSSKYYEVPVDILENPDELRGWAGQACQAASRRPERKKSTSAKLASPASGTRFQRRAIWASRDILLWNIPATPEPSCSLYYAPDASLVLTPEGIRGGRHIPLISIKKLPDEEIFRKNPYLRGWPAFQIPAMSFGRLNGLLKCQLAVESRDPQDHFLEASGLQIAGVLDAIFPYAGPLGVSFEGSTPVLRVWAPTARSLKLLLFESSTTQDELALPMDSAPRSGVWSIHGRPEWKEMYYLYQVEVFVPQTGRIETNRTTDPYSLSLSMDSRRSQIIDLRDATLKPGGWDELARPPLAAPEDITLYELHLRDFSVQDASVPAALRGTYAAFTVQDSRGMQHLRALAQSGLTHLHLLPVFDIATLADDKRTWKSVAEAELEALPPASSEQARRIAAIKSQDGFNWGYDPFHYSVPEGSYASDPDGPARILEFRQMVQSLHTAGLRVVMDVVYNHTAESGQNPRSVLDKIVPGYYYRLSPEGEVETSTCCQNTASEHTMMRKLMIDSVTSWARHYKLDGFRFDLMGHHMLADMLALRAALDALSLAQDGVDGKSIYIYGEGWNFGEVANNARGINATQANLGGSGIGVFNDRLRDGVRGGSAFGDPREQGFSTGLLFAPNENETRPASAQLARLLEYSDWIRLSLAGNLRDFCLETASGAVLRGDQLSYGGVPAGYTLDPAENVVYVSAHDNETLFDAIQIKASAAVGLSERIRMHNLALSLPMFSQGVPFFQAGDDILRSKSLERDSYDSGDWFNKIDWTLESNNWGSGLPLGAGGQAAFFASLLGNPALKPTRPDLAFSRAVFKEFLQIRRSSPLFRLPSADRVRACLSFLNTGPAQIPGLIVLRLVDRDGLDPLYRELVVLFNARPDSLEFANSGLTGLAFQLHPLQRQSADPRAREASFDPTSAAFTIPARTTSVFVLPKGYQA